MFAHFNVYVIEQAWSFAYSNIFSQIIGLCDGIIPYVYMVLGYPWIKRCHGNILHIYNTILSESIGILLYFNG